MMPTRFAHNTGEITITRLNPADWRDYKLLRLQALAIDPQAFEASYEEPDAYWRSQLQDAADGRSAWLLFAPQGPRLVGMVGALVTEERDVAQIRSVFVAPAARGRGLGTVLIGAMLRDLRRDRAVELVRLYVNAAQTAAVHLYLRFGFHVVEDDHATYGDGRAYTAT